jgi:protein-S-isoprenylcysteine O-methyltransferase Ste14
MHGRDRRKSAGRPGQPVALPQAARAATHLPWPPLLSLAAIAASLALNYFYPLPYLGSPLADILFAAGWLLVAGAVALGLSAVRTLHRHRTTVLPMRAANELVTTGPYAISRNPIYLGIAMATVGIGLITGIVWFFGAAFLAAALTHRLAILPEERHLDARFGKRFRDYRRSVRRWI